MMKSEPDARAPYRHGGHLAPSGNPTSEIQSLTGATRGPSMCRHNAAASPTLERGSLLARYIFIRPVD